MFLRLVVATLYTFMLYELKHEKEDKLPWNLNTKTFYTNYIV